MQRCQSFDRVRQRAVAVNRHRNRLESLRAQHVQEADIGGLFDEHGIAGLGQRLRGKRQPLRHTGRDDDLLRRRGNPALGQEGCQLDAQAGVALGRCVAGENHRVLLLLVQTRPELAGRKERGVGRGAGHGAHALRLPHLQDVADDHGRRHILLGAAPVRAYLHLLADKGTAPDRCFHPSATLQLGIGALHGQPRDAETVGKLAHRGQLRARRQPSAGNRFLKALDDLAIDWRIAAAVDRYQHDGRDNVCILANNVSIVSGQWAL